MMSKLQSSLQLLLLLLSTTLVIVVSSITVISAEPSIDGTGACDPVPHCPDICGLPCSSDALAEEDPYSALNFLKSMEDFGGTTCGDINVEFPFYDDSQSCPVTAVQKVTKASVDIPSFSVAAILGLVYGSFRLKNGFNRVLLGLTESPDPTPLRAKGMEWNYRKNIVLQQTAGAEGYFFAKVPCVKSDGKLNVSAEAQAPSLMTTALVMNTALITYGEFAVQNSVPGGLPSNQWPITPDLMRAHLDAFAATLQLTTVEESFIQEFPSQSPDDETFVTNSASHAVVLRVIDYATALQQTGYLMNVSQITVDALTAARFACEKHIELTCAATSDESNSNFGVPAPLVEGFTVYWPTSVDAENEEIVNKNKDKKNLFLRNRNTKNLVLLGSGGDPTNTTTTTSTTTSNTPSQSTVTPSQVATSTTTTTTTVSTSATSPTPPPPTSTTPIPTKPAPAPIGAKSSKTTSVFLAALPTTTLAKYCATGTSLGSDPYRAADHLIQRSLSRFGLQRFPATPNFPTNLNPVFDTLGITASPPQEQPQPKPDQVNCSIDVEATAWLNIAVKLYNRLESRGCAFVTQGLKKSEPFLRSYCRGDHNRTATPNERGLLSSWQLGDPDCGKPIPSTALTSLTAAILLNQQVFRNLPASSGTPTPSDNTPSPNGNNNDSGNSEVQNIEQVVLGIVFAVAIMIGVLCTVKYLRRQAHHRFARLEGGMVKNGDKPPSDLGYGTYSQVTSNTFM